MGGVQQALVWVVVMAGGPWSPTAELGEFGGMSSGTLAPAGLLAIVVLLIAFGKLVPRRTLEDTIKDRNEWRAAHQVSEQARIEQSHQMSELLEHSRATNALLQALPIGVARSREDP